MRALTNSKQKTNTTSSSRIQDIGWAWVMFFIFPVIVFYKAVRNFHIPQYRKFIVLFGLLWGITFIPIQYSDGNKYKQRFEHHDDYSFSQYTYDIKNIYSAETEYPDIYVFSLFYFLGNISNNPQFFFAITALIYFFVLITLLGSVYDEARNIGIKPIAWFFIGLVFLMNLSSGMNGVRWPLALMLFLLGSFKLLTKNNIKYLWLAGLSVFIHFAMLYAIIFLVIYFFTVRFYKPVYVYIFLAIVLFTSTLFSGIIQQYIGFFSGSIEERAVGYTTNELYKSNREAHVGNWNWYVQLSAISKRLFPLIALLVIAVFKRKIRFNSIATRLEYFAYLMMGASIISGELVDSISNRYIQISGGATLILLFYLSGLNYKNIILRRLSYIYTPLIILQILIIFRADLYTISPLLFFGNPLLMLFVHFEESIQSLILG